MENTTTTTAPATTAPAAASTPAPAGKPNASKTSMIKGMLMNKKTIGLTVLATAASAFYAHKKGKSLVKFSLIGVAAGLVIGAAVTHFTHKD